MIIARITGGIGNQLSRYAAGRWLAYKLNTELKLDLTLYHENKIPPYSLDQFNIKATEATQEEIDICKKISQEHGLEIRKDYSLQGILKYPDNIYVMGGRNEKHFTEIADIIKQDFTLKNPLSQNAEMWKQKILSADCSVSMHFRHGDYVYNPSYKGRMIWADIPPLDIYYNCLNALKQQYASPRIKVFVFSNNLQWIKENLHLDVSTEFVEGNARDTEELYLMSLCKCNIIPLSTFSWWASWLNRNPNKKVFQLYPENAEKVETYRYSLTPTNQNSPLDSDKWIKVFFDKDNCLKNIKMKPIFSLLLVVNNDVANLVETLNSLLGQDYKYYEIIIIDNASTDGSGKICQKAVKVKNNVTLKRLESKVNNATAWNIAFKIAQGKYVSFLKVGDRFLTNFLTSLYFVNERKQADIIHMFTWLQENEDGNISFDDKRFFICRDLVFLKEKIHIAMSKDGHNAAELVINRQMNSFLGTKIYNGEFLTEHGIKFDETLTDNAAEYSFQVEAFFYTKYFMCLSDIFYIAPRY